MTALRPSRAAQHRHPGRRPGGPAAERYPSEPHDWYVDPPWCTELLLDAVPLAGSVLDPACGIGTIPDACRRRGLAVTGSDLVDRGWPGTVAPVDFTRPGAFPDGAFDHVVSNPPYYGSAGVTAYARHGLAVARQTVCLLVPVHALFSETRYPLWRGLPVAQVIVLSKRPSMPPGGLYLEGRLPATGGKQNYVWVVLRHGHLGSPTLDWAMPW